MKKIQLGGEHQPLLKEAVHEARLLAGLDSPYIVRFYESFIEDSFLFLILELCDKGDLKSYLGRQMGRLLDEQTVWRFFLQLCLGLEHIHSSHVLHRDLKSSNVFLVNEKLVKIGDLGLATVLNPQSEFAHMCVGTPNYLSPELIEGKPYNQKSDIWALGCILYELLMLRGPFESNNESELIMKIRRASFIPVNAKYSFEIRNIVKICLQKNPEARPSISDLLDMDDVRGKSETIDLEISKKSILRRKTKIFRCSTGALIGNNTQIRRIEQNKSYKFNGLRTKNRHQSNSPAKVRNNLVTARFPKIAQRKGRNRIFTPTEFKVYTKEDRNEIPALKKNYFY